MQPAKLLIVMALPQESRGLLEAAGAHLLYTGVGKVNAAAALARRLAEMRCTGAAQPLVVNMGTAGSRSIAAHTLVAANRFAQRDMDVSGMGLTPGVNPIPLTSMSRCANRLAATSVCAAMLRLPAVPMFTTRGCAAPVQRISASLRASAAAAFTLPTPV